MPNNVETQHLKQYLAESRSWETDRLLQAEKSKKVAWTTATVAGALAIVSAVAVAGLTPLKKTELRIVRVNDTTGAVDILSELPEARLTYDEAINRYFAGQYLRFREGYSHKLADEFYTSVGILSAPSEQRRYGDWFSPKNPLSPLNVYGAQARVKVHIKGYSFIKTDVVLVRYWKEVEKSAAEKPEISHWAATIAFKYSGAPMAEKDREINPLGFQVVEYRNDPDSGTDGNSKPLAQTASLAIQPAAATPTIMPGIPPTPAKEQVPAIVTTGSVPR